MAREYTRRRDKSGSVGGLSRFLSMLVCLVMGYLLGSVFNVYQLTQWVQTRLLQPKGHAKPIYKVAPAPKPTFEFYTLLSQDKAHAQVARTQPVAPEVLRKDPATANKTVANTKEPVKDPSNLQAVNIKETYAIQVAAFNKREDAEALKGTLVLRGFDVMVSPITQKNTIWFRVMLGPYASLPLAQKTQVAILRNEHMKGMIRKI